MVMECKLYIYIYLYTSICIHILCCSFWASWVAAQIDALQAQAAADLLEMERGEYKWIKLTSCKIAC